jgi:hypothetical protein
MVVWKCIGRSDSALVCEGVVANNQKENAQLHCAGSALRHGTQRRSEESDLIRQNGGNVLWELGHKSAAALTQLSLPSMRFEAVCHRLKES